MNTLQKVKKRITEEITFQQICDMFSTKKVNIWPEYQQLMQIMI